VAVRRCDETQKNSPKTLTLFKYFVKLFMCRGGGPPTLNVKERKELM